MNLKNKVAVITGGCGQVGYATAIRLAHCGARIVSISRSEVSKTQPKMDQLPNPELGHFSLQASITETSDIKWAVQEIKNRVGNCDILVNAAGVSRTVPHTYYKQFSDELFNNIVSVNLKGPFIIIREFTDIMTEGLIVNISSTAGLRGINNNMAYAAAKAGVDSLTKSFARTLAPNIRVVSISPGRLENPTTGATPGNEEQDIALTPLGRLGTGDDIARTIEALATTMTYITGSSIILDGGRLT